MSVPKKRTTSSKKKRRASHFALPKIILSSCLRCKKPILPHQACHFCGMYAGKDVLKIRTKEKRGKKGVKEKEGRKK